MLKTAGVAAVGLSAQVCSAATKQRRAKKAKLQFKNASFYDASGKFMPEAGKDAYITLMEYHGYPVYPDVREKLWVSDYGTGQFTKLGLGANMFVNDEKDRYMVMDLYLLPNQMLPEHYHVSTDKHPAKMEGWVVRHGLSYVYGEGEPTPNMKAVVPKCHMNGTVTVSHEVILHPGQFTPQVRATARHWQYGGPEGAILTEVANVHADSGVRHSDANLVFP
jgi:D-lyxose ketol-isomerase